MFNKDIYTEEYLRGVGLNGRQVKAVMYVKENKKITNKEYQEIVKVSKPTASRELAILVGLNIVEQRGTNGKGTSCKIKGLAKGSKKKGVITGSMDIEAEECPQGNCPTSCWTFLSEPE